MWADVAGLLPPPPPGPGVCAVCRGPCLDGCTRCRMCAAHQRMLGAPADAVLPIALTAKGGPWAAALWQYKSDAWPAAARRRVGAVLAAFLAGHEPCVAAAAAVTRFDAVTVVPPSGRRGRWGSELFAVVQEVVGPRARDWPPTSPVTPAAVLLVEDTWTTGWHAQLAAAALKRAGVPRVGVLVLGRRVPQPPRGLPAFSWDVCTAPCRRAPDVTGGSPRRD